jgi:hypothetical protein
VVLYLHSSNTPSWRGAYLSTATIYILLYQNTGQNHTLLTANKSFEYLAELKYLRTRVTDQNCTHEEIKRRLNSGNACYHSVHDMSCRLLSKNLKIKNTKPYFYLLFCMGVSVGLTR